MEASRFKLGMGCSDPTFDQIEEVPGFDDNFLGLRMRRDRGMVVVDDVALPPAGFKKIEGPVCGRAECQPSGFKRQAVMARC
jgi:hypothetical protein